MPQADHTPIPNKILAALPAEEYERLRAHLTPVSLELGATLYNQAERIKYVYFVNTGVVSHVTNMEDGGSVEVGLVGRDGIIGLPIAFGDDVSPNHAVVQIAGGALRMEASVLREEFGRGGRFQSLLLRFTLAANKQVSQTAACNRSHNVGDRLARWLLMCHDRVEGDELELTQEFIAQMLGTRRSGVSEAAILLQAAGLIRYSRGHITVLDRERLKEFACECYEVVRVEFERLLG
jgi:CRP-like cAMP-binding protein